MKEDFVRLGKVKCAAICVDLCAALQLFLFCEEWQIRLRLASVKVYWKFRFEKQSERVATNVLQLPEEAATERGGRAAFLGRCCYQMPAYLLSLSIMLCLLIVCAETVRLDCKLFLFFIALAVLRLKKTKCACNLRWHVSLFALRLR